MKRLSFDEEIFTRGIADIVTRNELKEKLEKGDKLRVKHGIDATAPHLHIGHAASLWKLRALQEAGHKAIILLGDVTTAIGDPTGRIKTRPALSREEITANLASIKKQIKKILFNSSSSLEIHQSSEWYKKISTPEFIKILSLVTHARLIERDMFQKRIKEGGEVLESEVVYPVLQGYDSVMLKADLTVIGSDQLFNEHIGRALQEKFGQKPQTILALEILPGLDGGPKMSKSFGNLISLVDSPRDKFGKTMRVLDKLTIPYMISYTDVSLKDIKNLEIDVKEGKNPMDAKLFLAESLVRRYHGADVARKERERFLKFFSKKEIVGVPRVSLAYGSYDPIDLLLELKLTLSRAETKRLIIQHGVEVDGRVLEDPATEVSIKKDTIIRVGKRRALKIK